MVSEVLACVVKLGLIGPWMVRVMVQVPRSRPFDAAVHATDCTVALGLLSVFDSFHGRFRPIAV